MAIVKNLKPETKIAIALSLVAVLGPAAVDMYLPSIPEMAIALNSDYASMQLSLTVFLLSMGAGQLVFGPIIDAYGRKRPLIVGLVVYLVCALWAGAATSTDMLLAARFFQGLAAALALVVALSSVRDVADGVRGAQLFALLMTIEGLAPIVAPTIGGFVSALLGWRAVFVVLAGMGLICIINTMVNLPETLPQERRLPLDLPTIVKTYDQIARDGAFLAPALALSAAFFFLFAYIGGAAFVYQAEFGLSPDLFGVVFGCTGVALLLGAMTTGRLVARLPIERLAVAAALFMVAGAVIAAVALWFGFGIYGVVSGMFVALFGLGIGEATLMSIALSARDQAIGSSAAVLGAFQLVIASLATPFAGHLAQKGALPWLMFLVCAGLVVVALTGLVARAIHRNGRTIALQH